MMRFFKKKNRGQNVAEYAILIALVVGAIIAMQKFAQRGLQGRVRDATKYMVDNTNFGRQMGQTGFNTAQYEPYYQDSSYNTAKDETEKKGGDGSQETFNVDSTSNRTGASNTTLTANQTIGNGTTF